MSCLISRHVRRKSSFLPPDPNPRPDMSQRFPSTVLGFLAFSIVGAGLGFVPGVGLTVALSEEPAAGNKAEIEARQPSDTADRLQDLASQFQLELVRDRDASLKLQTEPLLTYTNPVRARGQIGSIFLWTQGSRPAVVGSLWTFRGKNDARLSIELHSLSQHRIAATMPAIENPRRTLPAWNPPESVFDWKSISAANANVTDERRLRILVRRWAEKFQAEVVNPNASSEEPLRRLSKPIYEYKDDTVAYGALFAFVLATDPELILSLEARKPETENAAAGVQLYYAFSRMTGRPLEIKLDGEAAQTLPKAPVWDGSQLYYFCPNVAAF